MSKTGINKREYALTLLARMIVRDYLGEIDRGEAGPNAFRESKCKARDEISAIEVREDNDIVLE
ncbi:MAG: hypothetical protein JW762_15055 [Dehalococcoidales bacterium]|nr:hypothetical protein [Dehalococcoidales bacterium]